MNKNKIQSDIIQSAISMKAHWDIWYALAGEVRALPTYQSVILEYSDFVKSSEDAHYTASYVYFAQLYDKDTHSSSIPNYLTLIQADTEVTLYDDYQRRYQELTLRAKPLLKTRNKLIAHVDAKLTERDFFIKEKITWNEIRDVMHDTAEFVAFLVGHEAGLIGIPRDGRLAEAVIKVFNKLALKKT
jgi:AbiU2